MSGSAGPKPPRTPFAFGFAVRAVLLDTSIQLRSFSLFEVFPMVPVEKPVFILNGPNLNLLGEREPEIYGSETLADIGARCATRASALGLRTEFRQSNHEGVLIDWIQESRNAASALLLNAGGLTHNSIAILDALRVLTIPVIEVHLSHPARREPFRHASFPSLAANGIIAGFGAMSYELALEAASRFIARAK